MTTAISHAELMALPIVRYDGPIHLNAPPADLHRALRHEHVVGFDTETRPTFRKGQSQHPPCLVQIATAHAVHLFQLARLDCSQVLTEIFANPDIRKVGVALVRDLADLKRLFPFEPANLLDLGDIVKRHGYTQSGVRNLTGLFLGARITKGARTTNWANVNLTTAQIRYAATDAWVCRELYLHFEKLGLLNLPAKPGR